MSKPPNDYYLELDLIEKKDMDESQSKKMRMTEPFEPLSDLTPKAVFDIDGIECPLK